jgi:conjugative transposon TraN protein
MKRQILKHILMVAPILRTAVSLLAITCCVNGQAQKITDACKSLPLEVAYNKTSTILFHSVITNVDRGSADIIAQRVKGVDNLLQVKAARDQVFPETNLTVVTGDGNLHHFVINYSEAPNHLTVAVQDNARSSDEFFPVVFKSSMNESKMDLYSKRILQDTRTFSVKSKRKYRIAFSLEGIYTEDDIIFCHIKLQNKSNIQYDIDMLRFYIEDKTKLKRTASQELQVKPLYSPEQGSSIQGKSTNNFVFALGKFTIPDAKHLVIQLFEKNGGRHLSLLIKNSEIVKARRVPDEY